MTALANRILGRCRVVETSLCDEDELFFMCVELKKQRATRSRRAQNIIEQERRCRGKVRRFGKRGQQREVASVRLCRNESWGACGLDGHSGDQQGLGAGCGLLVNKTQ